MGLKFAFFFPASLFQHGLFHLPRHYIRHWMDLFLPVLAYDISLFFSSVQLDLLLSLVSLPTKGQRLNSIMESETLREWHTRCEISVYMSI